MNSSSSPATPEPKAADPFAELLDMGFERLDPDVETVESVRLGDDTYKVTQVRPAMGSFVTITALHESHDLAEHAIGAAFEEMDRLVGLLNRFDTASPLAILNAQGRLIDAPTELTEVVRNGIAASRSTAGAFDITVKPVMDLFRDATTYEPLPEPDADSVRAALELVGSKRVHASRRDIYLDRAGMGLTLDGIAKGYIVDGVAAALERLGARRYLINAGGDIRGGGDRGHGAPWVVAVRDPDASGPSYDSDSWSDGVIPGTIEIFDGAVATSGSYETYFDSERFAHHIVDGGRGASAGNSLSVTVTAPTTVAADMLATSVFVLGPVRGTSLIDRSQGCESLIVDHDGNHIRSRGWSGTGGQ